MISATSGQPVPFDHIEAHAFLARSDDKLAGLIKQVGGFHFKLDECASVYESLLEAIAYQSISGKAAATIFARIKALGSNGCCPTPDELLRTRTETLRKAGLSGAKILAVRDLAQKTVEGIVPTLDDAEKMSDQELIERLTSLRGVGAWTVEMFLIFRLGRPDVLPVHDYGVQKGFALTYGKRRIPKPKELLKFGERWRPYRTVVSWYLWRAVEMAGKDGRRLTKNNKRKSSALAKKPGKRARRS